MVRGVYATDLATAARASGLPVVEVAGWQSRGHGGLARVDGIVAHHTATPSSAAGVYPSLNVVTNGRSDLPGPLCNLGLGRDGTVYVVAAGLAYHAGGGAGFGWPANDANNCTLGIEAEYCGYGTWPAPMLDAYPRLCAALAKHYGFTTGKIAGHLEWAPTRKIDPSNWPGGMNSLRTAVQAHINGTEDDMTPEQDATLKQAAADAALGRYFAGAALTGVNYLFGTLTDGGAYATGVAFGTPVKAGQPFGVGQRKLADDLADVKAKLDAMAASVTNVDGSPNIDGLVAQVKALPDETAKAVLAELGQKIAAA